MDLLCSSTNHQPFFQKLEHVSDFVSRVLNDTLVENATVIKSVTEKRFYPKKQHKIDSIIQHILAFKLVQFGNIYTSDKL